MKKCINNIKIFLADEKGAETVEWVMIAAVLASIIIAIFWTGLKDSLDTAIKLIGDKISAAGTGS